MKVASVDFRSEYALIEQAVLTRMRRVLDSQVFVLGPETLELEASLATLAGCAHAVACTSGSDALYLALLALGIGAGDAVLVPSFTFFATAGAVARTGALPVFTDIDPTTFNAGTAEFEACLARHFDRDGSGFVHRIGKARLRAMVPVHLYGRSVDAAALAALARQTGIAVVEDAAQAIAGRSDAGPVGGWSTVACFSFYPTKNLGGAGDGGAMTTRDGQLAARLRRLRVHGGEPGSYLHEECGINGRLSELQAAYLNAKLPMLEAWTRARVRAAETYRGRLASLHERGRLELAAPAEPGHHVYHQFVVRILHDRDAVVRRLADHGVEARVFYPLPLHLQPCFKDLGYRSGDLPEAEAAAEQVLALPIRPLMSDDEIGYVCERLEAALSV